MSSTSRSIGLQSLNKIDIQGVGRAECFNCTECPQFVSVPGHVLCAYCGCPPARHTKSDPGGLFAAVGAPAQRHAQHLVQHARNEWCCRRRDIEEENRRQSETESEDSMDSRESYSTTSSGVSSYRSECRSQGERGGWRPGQRLAAHPPRVALLLQQPPVSPDIQVENTWSSEDRSRNILIKPDDPLTFHRSPVYQTTDAIRGKRGYRKGLHAWEVCWPQACRGTHPVLGVATAESPLSEPGYKRLVGSNASSWGWCLKTLKLYHASRKFRDGVAYPSARDNSFQVPDTFYMLLDMDRGTLSFQIGEDFLGVGFSGLRGLELFPIASAVWGHCQVSLKYVGHHEFPSAGDSS